jgi:hypothetical protein
MLQNDPSGAALVPSKPTKQTRVTAARRAPCTETPRRSVIRPTVRGAAPISQAPAGAQTSRSDAGMATCPSRPVGSDSVRGRGYLESRTMAAAIQLAAG